MANIRTFKNLQDEVKAWLDEVGDTDVTHTLIKQSMRAAHEKRLTEERWPFMLSAPTRFSTVAGQQTYILDENFLRLMYVRNITNQSLLTEYQDENVLDSGSDWTQDTGSARQFVLWGHSEVSAQPLTTSTIAVTSTNSGDEGIASATITGTTTSGTQTETILCNGDPTVAFSSILKVVKSSNWVGRMTLSSSDLSRTYLSLDATEYGKSFQPLTLLATPTGVEVLEYRFYQQPSALVLDNARPDIPSPFEMLLVWDTLLDMATYNQWDVKTVTYWLAKRDELLRSMQLVQNQTQSINQEAVYTDFIPR